MDTPRPARTAAAQPWRRLAGLVAAVAVVLGVATAPALMLDPPERTGREGLARWRAWSAGELPVTDEYAAGLRDGFVSTTRPGGATVLGSTGPDGACWQLVVTDGVAVGPSRATDDGVCARADDAQAPSG